jgi:AcrR family transcriptional regulator
MARQATVESGVLVQRLSEVFRGEGYDGASLTQLADATGLKKASLYHRFPDGKAQMAREVLSAADAWMQENVIAALTGEGRPVERVARASAALEQYYRDGEAPCLFNMMASAGQHDEALAEQIREALEHLIEAFAAVSRDAGQNEARARNRAERAVVMLEGSLVLSRGLRRPHAFQEFLRTLPKQLLGAGGG